jgi:hypothetical protein
VKHIEELLQELGPEAPEAEDVGEDKDEDWETDEEEEGMDQN